MEQQVVNEINNLFQLSLQDKLTHEQLETSLASYINELINSNFEKLISILYRLDVHEGKLKQMLQQHNGEGAALIIAKMIIEREEQKIKTRQSFSREHNISEEEKW